MTIDSRSGDRSVMKNWTTWATACLAVLATWTAQAQGLPLIDTHSHFQSGPNRDFEAALRAALGQMDRIGAARTILMPPPIPHHHPVRFYDIEDLLFARNTQPQRVALMGGSSLNVMIHETPAAAVNDEVRARFRQRADAILAHGAVGFGEIGILHVSIPAMGPEHAYTDVGANHPLLLLLADIAAERDVPIDLHFDLVPEDMPLPEVLRPNPLNPPVLKANAALFRQLLAHNPRTRFVWSHVGFEPLLTRTPQQVRQFLTEFPNLHMSFRLNNGHRSPAAALDPGGALKPVWVQLVRDFPDRFMLGSDAFYESAGIARGSSERGQNNLRALVDALPLELGRAVASGNAVRFYKLAP